MKRKTERSMMNNRLAGILLFVLLALAFAGCSSSIASTPKVAATPTLKGALEVDIVLSDSAIQASQTTFALGVPYHFVVKNEGHVAQEFLIIPSLEQRPTRNLDQLALYHIVASQLPPKATSSFEFSFTRPAAQGQMEFASLLPGHHEAEMKLPITVNFYA